MISNCFYYGVYSPKGYYSISPRSTFAAEKNFVVKGYSNALKQRLFDKLKLELNQRGDTYTEFCTADGCEGIYSKDAELRVIDGTYNSFDESNFTPVYLDAFADERLRNSDISEQLEERTAAVSRVTRFISACRLINNDMMRLDSANIDLAKINRFSSGLWSSTGGILKGTVGTEHKRFVTCITPDGVELNMDAFDIYCDKMILIYDKTGLAARRITDRVRRYALSAGYDVISCICPMNIDMGAEHLIIPELKYGIFNCKHYHRANFSNSRKVFTKRFFTSDVSEMKNRMDFSMKAYKRLMQEVFSSLERVKKCDERLDEICSDADVGSVWESVFDS